jgi:ArsR family transcriptional regulator
MSKDLPRTHDLTESELRLVKMLKALGNPLRFGILKYLSENPVCITGEIVLFASLAQSTVSQHLKVLREAGLIQGEIEGPATSYCINGEGIRFLKSQIDQWLPCCRDHETPTSKSKCC